jgi:hypothetical protein
VGGYPPPERFRRVGACSDTRAPEQAVEPDGLPDDPSEIENLSWVRMRVLAARYSEELEGNGDVHQRAILR